MQETEVLCKLGKVIHSKNSQSLAERYNALHPHTLLLQSSVTMLHQPKTIKFVGTYITHVENWKCLQHFFIITWKLHVTTREDRQNNITVDQREVG